MSGDLYFGKKVSDNMVLGMVDIILGCTLHEFILKSSRVNLYFKVCDDFTLWTGGGLHKNYLHLFGCGSLFFFSPSR